MSSRQRERSRVLSQGVKAWGSFLKWSPDEAGSSGDTSWVSGKIGA